MGFGDGNSNQHQGLTTQGESVAMFTLYTLLLCGLIVPLSVYYMWELYKIRVHPVIEKRRPNMVLWYHFGLLLFTLQRILRCGLLCSIWVSNEGGTHSINIGNATRILSVMSVNFLLMCFVFRAYLLMFDLRYHKGILNGQWKQIINENSQSQDWFLNHRQTFGNEEWMKYRIFIPIYVCSIIPAIIANSGSNVILPIAGVTDLTVQISCFVAAGAIYFLSPKINDQFRIHDEFTLSCVLLGFGIILYPFGEILFGPFVDCLVTNMICGLIYYMVGLVPTYWVLEWSGTVSHIWQGRPLRIFSLGTTEKLRDRSLKSERGETQREELVNALKSALSLRTFGTSENVVRDGGGANDNQDGKPKTAEEEKKEQTNARKMREMLMTKAGFQIFMAHMIREFSEENLLFIVEVTQYFYYIQALYMTVENQLTKHAMIDNDVTMTTQSLALAGMVSEEHPIGMSKGSIVGTSSCLPQMTVGTVGFGSGNNNYNEIGPNRSIIIDSISPFASPMMSPFAPPVTSPVSPRMTTYTSGSTAVPPVLSVSASGGYPNVATPMATSGIRMPNPSESKSAWFPRYTRTAQAATLTVSTRTGMGTVVPDPENPVLHGMSWLGGLTLPNDLPQSTIVFGENNQLIRGGLHGTLKRFLFGRRGFGTSLSGSKPVPSEVVIKDLENLYNSEMVTDVATVAAKQAYSAMSSPKRDKRDKNKAKTWTESIGMGGIRKKPIAFKAKSSSVNETIGDTRSSDMNDHRLMNRVSSVNMINQNDIDIELKITNLSESTGDLSADSAEDAPPDSSIDRRPLPPPPPSSRRSRPPPPKSAPQKGSKVSETRDLHIDIVAAADAAVEMAFRKSIQRNSTKIRKSVAKRGDSLAVPKPSYHRRSEDDASMDDDYSTGAAPRPPSGTFAESTNSNVAEEAYDLLLQMTRAKAMKLCEKYVLDGSPFMVNIGYGCRTELTDQYDLKFNEHQLTDLQLVFANAAHEIMRLMINPFSRFLISPEFEAFEKLIKKR